MNLVLNGDFESGSLDHWYVHYAAVSVRKNFVGKGEKRVIDWETVKDYQPLPAVVDGSTLLPQQGMAIAPFQGAGMLRLNDLSGGNHVTCVHQTIVLPHGFDDTCAYISFYWGALLGGSGHENLRRPKFSFQVRVKRGSRWSTFLGGEYIEPSSPIDGWSDIRAPGEADAVWFKSGAEKQSLYGLKSHDTIRIRFVAEDCTDSAHGGAGFVDDVRISDECAPNSPVGSPMPGLIIPNVFTPNDDGVNDVWGLSGVIGACLIELRIFDRWGDLVYANTVHSFDGVWDPFVALWNGFIRTKRKMRGIGKRKRHYSRKISNRDMKSRTVFYSLTLKNCVETKEHSGFISVFL